MRKKSCIDVRDFNRESLYSAYATRACTRARVENPKLQQCRSATESANVRLHRDAKDTRESGVDLQKPKPDSVAGISLYDF